MKKHLHRLGVIYTVYGWLGVLGTIFTAFFTIRDIKRLENGMNATEWQLASLFLLGLTLLMALISWFCISFGNALKNEREWATRVAGFFIGFLLLFQFPVGTIIGGYTFWVLVKLDQSILIQTEQIK